MPPALTSPQLIAKWERATPRAASATCFGALIESAPSATLIGPALR